jgi:protein involved in polysaccharide export with SLBB domain
MTPFSLRLSGQIGLLCGMTFVMGCKSAPVTGVLPAPQLPTAAPNFAASQQTFQVGDNLELLVEEDPSFNGTYEVREGGYVLIPKVGRIPIVGLGRDQAESRVKDSLEKQQLKQASVYVERRSKGMALLGESTAVTASRLSVFVTGGVSRPGKHLVPLAAGGKPPGVYETLLLTGGVAKFGDASKVKIMRLDGTGLRKQMIVDVRKISEGKLPDVPVGEGDIIHVPEKVFGF